jgi:hypothetical protein
MITWSLQSFLDYVRGMGAENISSVYIDEGGFVANVSFKYPPLADRVEFKPFEPKAEAPKS